MRITVRHNHLEYPGYLKNTCTGILRRLYRRTPPDKNGKQRWERSDYLECVDCGAVFYRPEQGVGKAKILRKGTK